MRRMVTPSSTNDAAAALREVGATLLVRGWLSANNVVLRALGDDPDTVIDTGYVTHLDQTLALVRHALGGRPLESIVNTHLHSDHCGGNAGLQREWTAATVTVPVGYRDHLVPWNEDRLTYQYTGQQCERFGADVFLHHGTELRLGGRKWEVYPAPGHDPHAVMLFQPDTGVLISGDALWEQRLAIIFPALASDSGFDPVDEVLDAIERLAPSVVIPGHGAAFTDVAGAIAQSRARLEAFATSPERHRKHAARALVTYHMLEVGQRDRSDLVAWIAKTPVFREALNCDHDDVLARSVAEETLESLLRDGLLLDTDGQVSLRT